MKPRESKENSATHHNTTTPQQAETRIASASLTALHKQELVSQII